MLHFVSAEDGDADLLVAGLVAEGVVVLALPEDWLRCEGRLRWWWSFACCGAVRVAAGLQHRLLLASGCLASGCLASGPGGSQLADPNVLATTL